MQKLNLNTCVQWDTAHPALEAVQQWENDQLQRIQEQINVKKSHIEQLKAEKQALLNNKNATQENDADIALRQEKEAELNEIKGNSMRKLFWRKKIEDLEAEINAIDSRRNLAQHRESEATTMIADIDNGIRVDQNSIKKFEAIYNESANVLEQLKKETRTRMGAGVPFKAVNFEQLFLLMRDAITEGVTPYVITIQVENSDIELTVDTANDGTSVFNATLNKTLVFDESMDDPTVESRINALYALFGESTCVIYDMNEKPEQAMQGQTFDRQKMEEVYDVAGQVHQCVDNLLSCVDNFYRVMNLPTDANYQVDASLDKLEKQVNNVLDKTDKLKPVKETEKPKKPVKKEHKPVKEPKKEHKLPEEVHKPVVAEAKPAPKVDKEPVVAKPEPKPALTPVSTPKPAPKAEAVVKAKDMPEVQIGPEYEAGNGMLFHSEAPTKSKMMEKLEQEEKMNSNEDMNFKEFQETYQAEQMANIRKSKKTAREAVIEGGYN